MRGKTATILLTLAMAACSRGGEEKSAQSAAPAKPAAVAQAPAAPAAPPARKAGLWRQTVQTAGMTQTSRVCIDAAVEKQMSVWGQQVSGQVCSENTVTPAADGWSFTSRCDMGSGGNIVTTGVAKGDFDAAYRVTAKSTTTGAAAPQMNGEHDMTIEAVWEGPCPAGFAPGDMELPGGMKINMMKMAGKGG